MECIVKYLPKTVSLNFNEYCIYIKLWYLFVNINIVDSTGTMYNSNNTEGLIFNFVFEKVIPKSINVTGTKHAPNDAKPSNNTGSTFLFWNNICKIKLKVQTIMKNKQSKKIELI